VTSKEFASILDSLRIFPRLFCGAYIYMCVTVGEWFMNLPDPSTQQATLVSVVLGGSIGFFTAYVTSTNPKEKDHRE
jgi:hypothetical protein